MSLRDLIKRDKESRNRRQLILFGKYGVIENPFPAAGQPLGHPHLETEVDKAIVSSVQAFEDNQKSQILVIEGTQGVGKTNLLNYYQRELEDLYQGDMAYYIIRYYPDPEPGFNTIIQKIIQEFGKEHFERIGKGLNRLKNKERSPIIETAKNHDLRMVLYSLQKAADEGGDKLSSVSDTAMQWFMGLRVLKRHREDLGVYFRLDTVESKTQAFRDIICVSVELDILKGIFLMLDELEKHDYSHSKTQVLKYLYAVRALIDALPTHFFLMLALTVEARRRYFNLLPALAGRLQNTHLLSPLTDEDDACELYEFYLEEARKKAEKSMVNGEPGEDAVFEKRNIDRIFNELHEESANRGIEGVTHRDFLHSLYTRTQEKFENMNMLK